MGAFMMIQGGRTKKMTREKMIKKHNKIESLLKMAPSKITSSNPMNESLWIYFCSLISLPTLKTFGNNFFSTENEDPKEFNDRLKKLFNKYNDHLFSASIFEDILERKVRLVHAINKLNSKLPGIFDKWKGDEIDFDQIRNVLLVYFVNEAAKLWKAPFVLDSGHRKKAPGIPINVNPIVGLKKRRGELKRKLRDLNTLPVSGLNSYKSSIEKAAKELKKEITSLDKQIAEIKGSYIKRPPRHQGKSSLSWMVSSIYASFPSQRRDELLPDLAEIYAHLVDEQPDVKNIQLVKKRLNNFPNTKIGQLISNQLQLKYKVNINSKDQFWASLHKSILSPLKDGQYTITIERNPQDKPSVDDELQKINKLLNSPISYEPKEMLPPSK